MARYYYFVFIVFFLGACARPEAVIPNLDTAASDSERAALIRDAVELSRDRWARAHKLAWPVLAANTALCQNVRGESGLALADLETLGSYSGGIDKKQLRLAGYRPGIQVGFVTPGSPAASAGIKRGDKLTSIGDTKIGAETSVDAAEELLANALKTGAPVLLGVQSASGGPVRAVTVGSVPLCDVPLRLSSSFAPNAFATGSSIGITRGFLVNSVSDAEIQMVIAHELAHVTQRHVAKGFRNAIVSGSIVYGPVLGLAGTSVDIVAGLVGVDTGLGELGFAMTTYPWGREFEAEADYVGLYFYARAGLPLDEAEGAFSFLAREVPKRTYSGLTHPTLDKRVVAVRIALDEIRKKLAAGEPLIPNGVALKQSDKAD